MGNFSQFDAKNVCSRIEDMVLDDYFGEEEKPSPKIFEDVEVESLPVDFKVERKDLDNPQNYIGEYYSEELETSYLIALEGEKLILKNKNIHRRTTRVVLIYIGEDQFVARFWKWKIIMKFIHVDGKNTGFQIVNAGEEIQPHEFLKIER